MTDKGYSYERDDIDDGKLEIIKSNYDTKQIILARPGVGKTYTLVKRAEFLIDKSLNPGEVLILTFTRAAVKNIQTKLNKHLPKYKLPMVTTFDGFVGRFLVERKNNYKFHSGYNAAINDFIDLVIRKDRITLDYLSNYKHLMIDEAQDLVGIRLQMVKELLCLIDGNTIFCDIAQSIYRFTLDKDEAEGSNGPTFEQWMEKLKKSGDDKFFIKDLKNINNSNYRIEPSLLKIINRLREPVVSHSTGQDYFKEMINILKSHENLKITYKKWEIKNNETVIARDKSHMWYLFYLITNNTSLRPFIIPTSKERFLPNWIGRTFWNYDEFDMSFSDFEDLFSFGEGKKHWHLLQQVITDYNSALPSNEYINMINLVNALNRKPATEILYEEPDNAIKLGSIHRVKGREFESVVMNIPGVTSSTNLENLEEARIIYVAASRAKSELKYILSYPRKNEIKISSYDNRWLTVRNGWQVSIIMDHPNDVDHDFMARSIKDDSVWQEYQRRILELEFNTKLTLFFLNSIGRYVASTSEKRPQSISDPSIICVMSEDFNYEVRNIIRVVNKELAKNYSSIEKIINVVFLETITAVLNPDETSAVCYSGIFLSPRIGGGKGMIYFGR